MESWESYHGRSDSTGAYSHGGIRYSYTPVTAPCGEGNSPISTDIDDSEGVDEHHEDPAYDLDDPDGDPPLTPDKSNKVKSYRCVTVFN